MGRLLNQLFTLRRTDDYSDRFNLTKAEIIPKGEPTENFVLTVTELARNKLGIVT